MGENINKQTNRFLIFFEVDIHSSPRSYTCLGIFIIKWRQE